MKSRIKHFLLCISLLVTYAPHLQAQEPADPLTVEIVRMFSKDLFDLNSVPYLEPLVVTANAATNARFFSTAKIPQDSFYIRFGIHMMAGFVSDENAYYTPSIPTDQSNDTTRTFMGNYAYKQIKAIFARGAANGEIDLPTQAATIFGPTEAAAIDIPREYIIEEIRKDPLYNLLDSSQQKALDKALLGLPTEQRLPKGADISSVVAAVPQLEIGSYMGSELLLRYIPPVEFDEVVGEFSFFGIGIKHSLSQYFPNSVLDVAIQGAYQSTEISNTIGVTSAELLADADIYNVNLHASYEFEPFTVYAGYSYEQISINTSYTYTIPFEIQIQLGLVKDFGNNEYGVSEPDYPGDTEPQVSRVVLENTNNKFVLGVSGEFDGWIASLAYSFSQFNILSGGVQYYIFN